ncbi:MAG: hypothetical protein ACR2NZ_01950 [Rubripirellula sp.]
MSEPFEAGCYILVIHPNRTFRTLRRCYKKRSDAQQEKDQLLAASPDSIVFIHRARNEEELKAKRLARLCVVSHRATSQPSFALPAW